MAKPIVQLVRVGKRLLVPASKQDCLLMCEAGFTSTRINAAQFDLLKSTLLKGFKFNVNEWSEVEELLFDQFEAAARSIEHPDFKVKRDSSGVLMVLYSPKVDLDLADEGPINPAHNGSRITFTDALNKVLDPMRKYLGQYCHGLQVQFRDTPSGGVLWRLTSQLDESRPNALFYDLDFAESSLATLNMGKDYRIKFEIDLVEGVQVLRVTNEDRMNGQWLPHMVRSFATHKVDPESTARLVSFLLSNFTQG